MQTTNHTASVQDAQAEFDAWFDFIGILGDEYKEHKPRFSFIDPFGYAQETASQARALGMDPQQARRTIDAIRITGQDARYVHDSFQSIVTIGGELHWKPTDLETVVQTVELFAIPSDPQLARILEGTWVFAHNLNYLPVDVKNIAAAYVQAGNGNSKAGQLNPMLRVVLGDALEYDTAMLGKVTKDTLYLGADRRKSVPFMVARIGDASRRVNRALEQLRHPYTPMQLTQVYTTMRDGLR